jgi:hypothetical protein
MLVKVGLELNDKDRAIAWALDYPGCFAYGKAGPDAIVALANALVAYEEWANRHGGVGWLQLGNFDVRLVDTWRVYEVDDQYELAEKGFPVESWFLQDWQPLRPEEIERGLLLLSWTREDLLRTVEGMKDEQLDRQYAGERLSIRGILKHVANAEWRYLDCLGWAAQQRDQLPEDAFERLSVVREQLKTVFQEHAGKEYATGKGGEFWSPRKLLRRALWHEIDHRQHILKLSLFHR